MKHKFKFSLDSVVSQLCFQGMLWMNKLLWMNKHKMTDREIISCKTLFKNPYVLRISESRMYMYKAYSSFFTKLNEVTACRFLLVNKVKPWLFQLSNFLFPWRTYFSSRSEFIISCVGLARFKFRCPRFLHISFYEYNVCLVSANDIM